MGPHRQRDRTLRSSAAAGPIQAKQLKLLGVASNARLNRYPDVPTIAESGYPGFETRTWYGLFGPAGMPADVVRKLHADTDKVMRMPEVANNLVAQGWDIAVSPPDQFSVVLQSEFDRWSAVVKRAGIKAN